jgi:hypothetical protein
MKNFYGKVIIPLNILMCRTKKEYDKALSVSIKNNTLVSSTIF